MSNTESDYSDSPRAFEEESASESSTTELESADFEGTRVGGGIEVSTDSGSTSSLVGVPLAKPTGPLFGVDFLEPNALNEAELAKIRAEYHLPDSIVMRIPRPLESLSNPEDDVVFFTDVFKHRLRLPQFNPNFWITLLGTITAFGITGEGELSYEQFTHLYSVTRAKSADQGVGAVKLPVGRPAWAFCGWGSELIEDVATVLGGAWESAPGVIIERNIPKTFQIIVAFQS
ncbi:unnamed protein product [Prunus armeniaca]